MLMEIVYPFPTNTSISFEILACQTSMKAGYRVLVSQTTPKLSKEKATCKKVSFYLAARASIHDNFDKRTSTSPHKIRAQNLG